MAFGETVAADEAERFRAFAEEIASIQQSRMQGGRAPGRVMHAKQHTGAVGELVVTAPEGARSGVFQTPGQTWPVYCRFSNGSGLERADGEPDVRGFAVKLVGVPGRKLIEGLENETTQDFLFINEPVIPFRDPYEFMSFVRAAKDGPTALLPRLIGAFGFGRAFSILWGSITSQKVKSFATHTFHTAAPLSFAGSAAKLALVPDGNDPSAGAFSGRDYLQQELRDRLRRGPLSWSLRAQRFIDEATTPIEDTTVRWTGDWIELGKLTLPQQDADSARGREISALVTEMSFDPWHAIEEHRPLGAVMRARKVAYAPSIIGRKAAPEPREVLSSD